ncbi:MAG: hypothetical protein ABIJ00_14445 [Candidatus Eisenbacteria bacterium]
MRKKLWYLFVFALAMGYLEAAVVVYLRQLFYPDGFAFPIKQIDTGHAFVELGREAATVFMLLAVAFIAERTKRGRLICFILLFGIWDIAYYLWLWVTISWPASLLTWDILFLIPVIWTGPVLAPVLVSVLMIVTGLVYYVRKDQAEVVRMSKLEWVFTISAAAIIFGSFTLNHGVALGGGVPSRFAWEVFAGGMALGVVVLTRVVRRLTSPA